MSQLSLDVLLDNLVALSPMPSDEVLLDDETGLVDRYDDLIEAISQRVTEARPSPTEEARLVKALADSFGPGDGLGTFWGTLHLIERCAPDIALPIVQERAVHGTPGCRFWCCFILGRRRNEDDLPIFLSLLRDEAPDVQEQALMSLEMLSQRTSLKHILPLIVPLTEHPVARVMKAARSAVGAIGVE